MNIRSFIIGFMLCGKVGISQLSVSKIDSLNAKMLSQNVSVDLTEFGTARIQLKEGVTFLNCIILEVKTNYVVYKKRGTLHDQAIDKIKRIEFEEHHLKLEFDYLNRGKIEHIYP